MKRIIVGILLAMFLVACGGGGTIVDPLPKPPSVQSEIIPGTFIGTIGIADPPADKKYGGLTTLTIDKQGTVTGTITSVGDADNATNGTYTGTATISDERAVFLELDVVFPGIGTYTSKIRATYFENTDKISGATDIRDAASGFVGNASISILKDKSSLPIQEAKPPTEVVDTFKGTLSFNDEIADYNFDSLVTMSIDQNGNVTGSLTPDTNGSAEAAKGTLKGKITTYNEFYLLLDFEITYESFGTYVSKANGAYFENTDRILGDVYAKNANGDFVGSGNLIVTRD